MTQNKNIVFHITVLALFLGIISPSLFNPRIFMDGLLYANISRNLAQGIGSFWDLQLTNTLYPDFHEHPPLAFGIQSIFFKIFPDSIFIEKFYSLLTFVLTGFIIIAIWKQISRAETKKVSWLPLLLLATVGTFTWTAPNNMLENTMMIFTSLSVYFFHLSQKKYRFLFIILAGFSIFCGFLTKGFVALFPLSFGFWLWLFQKDIKFKRFFIDNSVFVIASVLPFIMIYFFVPDANESFNAYFNKQVVGSIQNVQTVNNRFSILEILIVQLLPAIALIGIFLFFTRKRKVENKNMKWTWIFLLLGLSGVLPIMISMKQRAFYILATYPFFAISIANIISQKVSHIVNSIDLTKGFKIFKKVSYLILGIAIFLNIVFINSYGKDEKLLKDVFVLSKVIKKGETIYVNKEAWSNWSLHGYLYRYANISLDKKNPENYNYLLLEKEKDREIPGFKKSNEKLTLFYLYKKIP